MLATFGKEPFIRNQFDGEGGDDGSQRHRAYFPDRVEFSNAPANFMAMFRGRGCWREGLFWCGLSKSITASDPKRAMEQR
jgi:hypothetical protein